MEWQCKGSERSSKDGGKAVSGQRKAVERQWDVKQRRWQGQWKDSGKAVKGR